MSTRLSVVICTLNRAEQVRLALDSLTTQTVGPEAFEVVVVDNGSTDGTPEVVLERAASMPNLRLVRESELGLSHARNRGTLEADAPVVLFLDDDAVAEPQLVEAHLRRFEAPDGPAATAGRIYLRWSDDQPPWVPAPWKSLYSGLDLGDQGQVLTYPEYPYGANMAIRRALLCDLGGFATDLGRRGRSLISGEEKDLFQRIADRGERVEYVPDAVVHHIVLPEREHRRWLLRRALAQGRSDVVMDRHQRDLSRPALAARSVVHLGRAGSRGAQLVNAVARRRPPAEVMDMAAQTMRWFGAAYQGAAAAVERTPD